MMQPLSILVGADVLPDANSGAAGTVLATNEALAKIGHTIESFWADSLGRRISHGNLHYILELPRTYRRMVAERVERSRYDVVQLSQPHSYLAGRMLMKRPDRPLMVWRSHGLEAKVDDAILRYGPPQENGWRGALRNLSARKLRWAQSEAVRWSDGAVVPCEDDKQFLIEQFGAEDERVRVIWHGVPDRYIDAPQSTDPDRWRRILHVSQLSANKGPMIMHEVATRVLESQPHVSMTWVCPSSLHDRARDSLPPNLRSRIDLRDWISREALMDLYDSHGLFIFPTLAEGAAKVVMEAMARGMCVIASDTSGPSDYIRTGTNGVLVPVGNAPAMACAAEALLANPSSSRQMGLQAGMTAKQFRWSRCATELVHFYEDLMLLRVRERA